MIVSFAAGAASDAVARIVADGLSRVAGKEVIVINQPGANGQVAINRARTQPADGRTLLFLPLSIIVDQAIKRDPRIDVTKDILPIARVIDAPLGLFVSKQTPVNSVQELIEHAKKIRASSMQQRAGWVLSPTSTPKS